jgi:hypothetical protein
MAGMTVCVCLPAAAGDDIVAAVGAAMAPFELMCVDAVERWCWDSWRICGGHDGHGFWVVAGAEHSERLIHDQPHRLDGEQPSRPGMCAGGPRGLLDLHRRAADAERAAGEVWDLVQRLRTELPPVLPREHFVALPENQLPPVPGNFVKQEVGPPMNRGVLQAWEQYDDQPIMCELRASPYWPAGELWSNRPPWSFDLSRDEYVAICVDESVRWFCLLTLDGWWVDPQYPFDPPVHGACDSWAACTHREGMTEPWTWEDIEAYLDRLPDDVIIVRLHGHV